MKKRLFWFLLSILLLFSMAGCGRDIPVPDDSEIRTLTVQMLDGVLAGDYDACRAAVCPEFPDRDIQLLCEQGADYLQNPADYQLEIAQCNRKTVNDVTQLSVRYRINTDKGIYYVDVRTSSEEYGLYNFHLFSEEDLAAATEVTVTGTMATFGRSDTLQKALLIVGLAEFVFVAFSAVYCFRKKTRYRWLWLLLIVLVSVLIRVVTAGESISTHLHAGVYLTFTSLLRDSAGVSEFRLYIPVGAILIWIIRPWKKQRSPAVPAEPEETPPPEL